MKILTWVNGISLLFFVIFTSGVGWAYWIILPKMGNFQPPPSQAGQAINSTEDLQALREMASLLYQHVIEQTIEINSIFSVGVFGLFVYGFLASLLALGNLVLIYRFKGRYK